MAYAALYRKWRPKTFNDVKGQNHIVTTLKNQINSNRVGHAYLFCGTRGTGKTSVAKIFARAVNCEHPVDGNPCNECNTCKAILSASSMNVVEIDAASNNGVDNIREIRDEVQYSPTEGKYRVYIIDEVHMLSAGAFNALLKTLEEPPSYVIFILATTEVHKIPITVLSRCQRYDFKRMTNQTLFEQLELLSKSENIKIEEKALKYIAKLADGSMRDSQSLLERCLSFLSDEELSYEKVLDILGAVDTGVFSELFRYILKYDVTSCIKLLDRLVNQGRDLGQFVLDFTWYLRNILLLQTTDNAQNGIDVSEDNLKLLKEEAKLIDIDTIIRYIRIFSELSSQIKYVTSKRIILEIAIIKMMKPEMETDLESVINRLDNLENHINSGIFVSQDKLLSENSDNLKFSGINGITDEVNTNTASKATGKLEYDNQAFAAGGAAKNRVIEVERAAYDDYKLLHDDWNKIVSSLNGFVRSLLIGTRLGYEKERGFCILFYDKFNYEMMCKNSLYEQRLDEVEQRIKDRYQKQIKLQAVFRGAEEKEPEIMPNNSIPGIEMEIGVES